MSANPAFVYPGFVVEQRVRVVAGGISDLPYYRYALGTVLQTFPRLVEVKLDCHSFPAVFAPEDLELVP
ncbi:MAG: hypothetical protein ACTHJ9_13820 [Rhodanobacter sp.]